MDNKKFIEQKWQNATIQENFIFSRTFESHSELCIQLLEMILQIKIAKIIFLEREKTIETRTDSKGIRLDVYAEDDANRTFDLEMQILDKNNIAKRMRYYQGLIDGEKLKPGQLYNELGESFIIFICPFDKFKKGRHIYTFREFCVEDNEIELHDGATKIFLNTKGTCDDVSEDIKNFLNYVESGIVVGDFVKKLDAAVWEVKTNQRARLDFMTYEMALLEREAEGIEKGIEQGEAKKQIEMVKNLLLAKTPLKYIIAATGWNKEKILSLAEEKNAVD